MPRLVIKSHRPLQLATAIVILSTVMALITWLFLDSSHWALIHERISGNRDTKSLLETNQRLSMQNKTLQDQVLLLGQTTRLDKETAVLLQKDLIASQDQISRLTRELEFYQTVMETARKTTGIDVHGLHVESLVRENQYLLKLVLTNVAKSDRVTTGTVDINIKGTQHGSELNLNLSDLVTVVSADFSFELKSFKGLDYSFQLPSGFVAESVLVQISPKGESAFSKIFDWPIN